VTTLFLIYLLFLIGSGIAMLAIAGVRRGQGKARRLWTGVLGAGFLIYGLYLLLFFRGGHFLVFYYVFILPILVIVRFFRDRFLGRKRQQAVPFQDQPPAYGQPPAHGQPPGYGQPPGSDQPPGRL